MQASPDSNYLYCSGEYGSFYRLDKGTLDIIWYSRYADTLAHLSNLGNTGITLSNPSDIFFQSPDQLLILDKQNRTIFEFNRHLNYIKDILLPDQFISPVQFVMDPDKNLIIYDDFHQQLYKVDSGKAMHFTDENTLYSSMDKNMDLIYFDKVLWLFLPGEGTIISYDQNGVQTAKIRLPEPLSGTLWKFFPYNQERIALYNTNSFILYNIDQKKQTSISVLGLNWSYKYHRQFYLSEGSDTVKIRSIRIR